MTVGEIFVDGKEPPAVSGQEMCETVIAAGLYDGTPEQLWNHDPGGHLITVHELYWKALSLSGHRIEIETQDGARVLMHPASFSAAPKQPLAECVARALCSWLNGKKRAEHPAVIWAKITQKQKAAYREQAQAAIDACHAEEMREALELIAKRPAPSPDEEDAVPTYSKVVDDYTRRVAIARAAIAKLDGKSSGGAV